MSLPATVAGYLQHMLTGVFQPAYILVDARGSVRQTGGNWGRYGYDKLAVGDTANEKLWFLAGILPIEGDEPLVLPSVSISDGGPTHIHVIPADEGTWVLLVDACDDNSQHQLLKQAYNRLDLLRQQQSNSIKENHLECDNRSGCAYATALGSFGGVLLERTGDVRFSTYGTIPEWLKSTYVVQDNVVDFGTSPFLTDFLDHAEAHWRDGHTHRLDSGLWTETTPDGGEEHLEAIALPSDGRSLLFLCRRTREHDEQQRILQTAREQNLRFERLLKQTESNEILVHCIVHDLNGPLSGMMSCFDLLDLQDLGDKAKDLVQLGLRQAMSQRALIHGILDAFAAEVESLHHVERDPHLAPDLLDCTRAVVENLTPVATTHGVSLELFPPAVSRSSWKVVGERTRLDRVLANLVDNAIRHSPPASHIRIRLEGDRDNIICHVEDEGSGIPDTLAGTLFNKLTKTADGGGKTGLGLYFCRITVERWGGAIGFSPRPGGGTSFWFRLEAADLPDASEVDLAELLAGKPVLVVEDDDVSRRIVKELLIASGIRTIEAASGEAALAQAAKHLCGAALMDVHLPGMSGLDAAIHLRDREVIDGPIIAVTADVDVTESMLGRLFDEVIQKPFSLDQLRSVLVRGNRNRARSAEGLRESRIEGGPFPVALPGIDLEGTLTRLGGDVDLLNRLLSRFEARCREAASELGAMVRSGRRHEALNLVHSLKGTAANLGAIGIVGATQSLDTELRSNDAGLTINTADLVASIEELSTSQQRLHRIVEGDNS